MNSSITAQGRPVDQSGISGFYLPEDLDPGERKGSLNREGPPRQIHAKGIGAHGVFEVIRAVPEYSCAAFLAEAGKKTEVFVRFSIPGGERGSADSQRALREFAVKFYTSEGIYDLVGSNIPVHFLRDTLKLPKSLHIYHLNPLITLGDPNSLWNFWSRTPASLHQAAILFSDRGTPASYRSMHGFGGHTYMWYNEKKDHVWVKYHWVCGQPIRNFTDSEAEAVGKFDPDHGARDLHGAIVREEYPEWILNVQIMTGRQAENFRFDPFDATKVWYHHEFPLIPVGRLTLNRNPEDYFSEREQGAFSPGNLVPGIALSPDRLLQERLVSAPPASRFTGEDRTIPPPVDLPDFNPRQRKPLQDFEQPGLFYRKALNAKGQSQLCDNLAASLEKAERNLQYRETAFFTLADPDWGWEMAKRLHLNFGTLEKLSALIRPDADP
jgi:catalase